MLVFIINKQAYFSFFRVKRINQREFEKISKYFFETSLSKLSKGNINIFKEFLYMNFINTFLTFSDFFSLQFPTVLLPLPLLVLYLFGYFFFSLFHQQ